MADLNEVSTHVDRLSPPLASALMSFGSEKMLQLHVMTASSPGLW